jgi:hypothetical protein
MTEAETPLHGEGAEGSMYLTMLTGALDDWRGQHTKVELVNHALLCRRAMLVASSNGGDTIYRKLAADIAYDRSLIKLCQAYGVTCDLANFAIPNQERIRVEAELVLAGINLGALLKQPGD